MPVSSIRPYRGLEDVVPLAIEGFQANSCGNPAWENYGVASCRFIRRTQHPKKADKVGRYLPVGTNGDRRLQCTICGR
jgi:hypothetical protein